MFLVVLGVGCVDVVNSWLLGVLVRIVESVWVRGLEFEPVVPWLLKLGDVLRVFVEPWSFFLWHVDRWVLHDVLWLARVLVGHVVCSLIDILVGLGWSWLRVEIIGVEGVYVNCRISGEASVLEVIFLDGLSVPDKAWTLSDRIFSVRVEGVGFAQIHVGHVFLDVGWLVGSR